MKRIFLIFICFSLLMQSCENESSETAAFNKYVNEWVYDNMSMLYYWNTNLPVFESSKSDPKSYFETLIYKDDRFSSIFESYTSIQNELNGVSESEAGFEFQLFKESYTNDNILGIVLYIKPGTPAESMGIKRGDMFRKLNNTQMTISNYREVINYLYDSSGSVDVTFSTFINNDFVDMAAVKIAKISAYHDNPIYLDTVYTVQNTKIGYLIYNFFAADAGDESLDYDLALNGAFGRFKAAGIQELIVDLRYNHGGSMSSAINLSSMMVPGLSAGQVFSYTEFNKNFTDYFNSDEYKEKYSDDPFVDNFATTIDLPSPKTEKYPIQNVGSGLQRIFFLTGRGTASASEMVINGLKPFLPCVLIGDTTVGKNVGSILINDEENEKNEWAILPIVLRYFNKDRKSDFTQGFFPDFYIEDDYAHQLGDVREALLAKAISSITGVQNIPAQKAKSGNIIHNRPINLKIHRNELIVKKKSIDVYLKRDN